MAGHHFLLLRTSLASWATQAQEIEMPYFCVQQLGRELAIHPSKLEAVRDIRSRIRYNQIDNRTLDDVIADWRERAGCDCFEYLAPPNANTLRLAEARWVADNGPC